MSGPSPFPTPYWAYTLENTIQQKGSGFSGWSFKSDPLPCGYHYIRIQKEAIRNLPSYIDLFGIKPLAQTYNGSGVVAYICDVPTSLKDRSKQYAMQTLNEINLGQALGELTSSSIALYNAVDRLLRALAALKRGDVRALTAALKNTERRTRRRPTRHEEDIVDNAARDAATSGRSWTSAMSEAYIAWIWGFAPLIDAVQNGLDAIHKAFEFNSTFTLRGLATDDSYPVYPGWSFGGNLTRGATTHLTFGLDDDFAAALNRIGLGSVLGLAWELVPLSFIVNWIVSVGDFLNSLNFGTGLSFKYGHQTSFVRGDLLAITDYQLTGYARAPTEPCIWKLSRNVVTRDILSSFVRPGIHMKWALDSNKATSLLALLAAVKA
jgi:hypothetical protein